MPSSIPERVRYVQQSSGRNQAEFAREIGLDSAKFSKGMSGTRRFSSFELALIADIGHTTVDWLLSGEQPRSLAFAARAEQLAPAIEARGRELLDELGQRYDSLARLGLLRAPVPLPARSRSSRYVQQASDLAEKARSMLDVPFVDLDTSNLIERAESTFGLSVMIDDLPDGLDGLSYQDDAFRAIVLGRTTRAPRQRYTLAHEIGHVLWGDASEGVIAENVSRPSVGADPFQEKRANAFAAALLMSERDIDTIMKGATIADSFDELVVRLGVAPDALAWRLLNLSKIDDEERASLSSSSARESAARVGATSVFSARCQESNRFRPPMPLVDASVIAYESGKASITPLATLLRWSPEDVAGFIDNDPASCGSNEPEALS